ncbi:hypothetical protein JKF63_05077 [Porcisia hertigi]|uniref:aspartate--tRNA ligase n=1 Tax=Porcisia hertigi TaxID=2761500 RepID=A0A836I6U5_9TRYP|nr:hypothetical protein JKF63_05077 [Porcisia hertigi]
MPRVSLSLCVSLRSRRVAGLIPGVGAATAAVVAAASPLAINYRWTPFPTVLLAAQRFYNTNINSSLGVPCCSAPQSTASSSRSASSVPSTETATWTSSAPSESSRGVTCLTAHGVSIASLRAALTQTAGEDGSIREGDLVSVRARLERVRGRGKVAFLHLRQPPLDSVQAVCEGSELAKQARSLTPESIIDVTGVVRRAATPVRSTTCQGCELQVTALGVVSRAASPLPFPYNDTNAKLDTRLNHRIIDLRTDQMVATSRLVSALEQSFRNELLARDFIEVHTPKLLGATSEGGSDVFQVSYFTRRAYLAQSPQLHKQMLLMGDAMRVFEVGPVFRAEKSLTHRHLTEFVGLDGEMVIKEDHTEVLDVLEPVVCAVLAQLTEKHGHLMHTVWKQQQQQQGAGGENDSSDPQSAAAAAAPTQPSLCSIRGPMLGEVCCEVSLARMESLGIITEASPTMRTPLKIAEQVDPYHARVGGDGSRCRVLRMTFANAARLLTECGGGSDAMAGCTLPLEDFTLPQERLLGQLMKMRYGVDLYVIDGFPSTARPFYTMPVDPSDPDGPTRSFDLYLRGEEICSGAQRVHEVELLEQRLSAKRVDKASMKDYVDSFRYGAWPHGGFGLGLERIALFFLGLDDIRQVSLFPRDPKRLSP